ncbi:hypothetical protein [uncultured Litoreibacter sp.]|uniref:hypothetical protein n=1 Tax=uncultured Litoreibacter sp. TaxID=1392394 RepID=UPI002636A5C3|nr:hypothetical protein [uncultured Litoreibacter sp.]
MKFTVPVAIVFVGLVSPTMLFAENRSLTSAPVAFCDPLLSEGRNDLDQEDGDDEELAKTHRYDLETSERLISSEQIMNALFEEKWNLSTGEPIQRYELCSAEENYVILWSRLFRPDDEQGLVLDAEGYMSIRKDGSFKLTYAQRPYLGTWELDGTDMVLSGDWLNNGDPYRAPVELVRTPVETVDGDGVKNSFLDENYRIGGFRFYRLPTTIKGSQQNCSCTNQNQ